MEKRTLKKGFFIRFEAFASTLVYSVGWNQSGMKWRGLGVTLTGIDILLEFRFYAGTLYMHQQGLNTYIQIPYRT